MARGAHRARCFLIGLALLVLCAPTVAARADSPESKVSANDNGVRIEIERKGRAGGNTNTAPRRAARPTTTRPVCRLVRIPASRNLAPRFRNNDPTHPLTPFAVVCNGRVTGVVWLDRSGARRATIATATEQLVRDVPLPTGEVRISPANRGLTGMETWFWVDGLDGKLVTETVSALGASVDVEATPTAYDWNFGDGASEAGDLGRPAPQRSSVTHVYETTSGGDGFLVQMAVTYNVRYRVDGGAWIDLPPVTRRAVRSYPVVEVRAQLSPAES